MAEVNTYWSTVACQINAEGAAPEITQFAHAPGKTLDQRYTNKLPSHNLLPRQQPKYQLASQYWMPPHLQLASQLIIATQLSLPNKTSRRRPTWTQIHK